MRFGDERESNNFEDATGRSGGGLGFGGGGGNPLGCLIPLVASRFGIGGVDRPRDRLLPAELARWSWRRRRRRRAQARSKARQPARARSIPNTAHFMLQVLASTEDVWGKLLGGRYTPTKLVAYSRAINQAAARRSRRWGPSIARPTRRFISTPSSSTNCRSASRRPAILPKLM